MKQVKDGWVTEDNTYFESEKGAKSYEAKYFLVEKFGEDHSSLFFDLDLQWIEDNADLMRRFLDTRIDKKYKWKAF